jgi:hypothetical protein
MDMRLRRILQCAAVALAISAAVGAQAKEKDLKNMVIHYNVTVPGAHLSSGSYSVQWLTHSPEATVKFVQDGKVVGTAEGKLVDRGYKYQSDEVMYDELPGGLRVIREIRFKGSSEVLEFN